MDLKLLNGCRSKTTAENVVSAWVFERVMKTEAKI